MRVPDRLEPLLNQGVIEEVLRPLMSGKEAEVFLVRAAGIERVAKVYKNAQFRSFQHRTDYTEGRRVRSSREQRAMSKRSRHGRAKTEEAWRSAEVDAIHLLRGAGVRVPEPIAFVEGVLVMELVTDASGAPAPRMVDINFSREEAEETFQILLREVVKMLCAGIIHADLSDFNVLMSPRGPVIIDFPQAVDPARNQSAQRLLLRDVKNLTSFLGRFAPALLSTQYGPEMWELYERSELEPDTVLTGKFTEKAKAAEVDSLLEDILQLEQEARERREALGLPPPRRARRPVIRPEPVAPKPPPQREGKRSRGGGGPPAPNPKQTRAPQEQGAPPGDGPPKRRRRRRGGGGRGGGAPSDGQPSGPPQQQTQRSAPKPPAQDGGGADGAPKKRRRRRRRGGGGGRGEGGGGDGPPKS